MTETIASLGLRIDSSQAAAAAPIIDKVGDAAERTAVAIDELAAAATSAASAEKAISTSSRELAAVQERNARATRETVTNSRELAAVTQSVQTAASGATGSLAAFETSVRRAASAQQTLTSASTGALGAFETSSRRLATAQQAVTNTSAAASVQMNASIRDSFSLAAAESRTNAERRQSAATMQRNVAALMALKGVQTEAVAVTGAATLSAKQYSQALRLLPAQITDIVTGLASGQSPFLVAIQQGGQLRDSFGGFGATLRAVVSFVGPMKLALLGIAGAVAGVVTAFARGQAEVFELEKAVALSGNAAGVTSSQLAGMAKAIDAVSGTRGQASAALGEAVSTGRITAQNLQQIAQAAIQLQKVAGVPLAETLKDFAALGAEPVRAAERLQQKYNFLTVAILDQIRALERQGNFAEAANLAQKTLLDATTKSITELSGQLGALPRAWNAVTSTAREAWDAMLGLGRGESPAEEIARLQEQLRGEGIPRGGLDDVEQFGLSDSAARQRIAELNRIIQARGVEARAAAAQARALQDDQARRALEQVRTSASGQTSAASFQANAAAIERALNESLSVQSNYEKVLEAQRAAHLVSETDYYAARQRLIEGDRNVRVAALQNENKLLEAEQARIRAAADATAAQASTQAEAERARLGVQPTIIANQTKIAQNTAEIARVNAEAAASAKVLGIEQADAAKRIVVGMQDARDAAQAYLDTLQRRQRLEVEGLGQGSRTRDFNQGRSDLEADYARQRQQLDRDLRRNQITKERYDEELKIIDEFQGKALKSYDDYWSELTEKQGSFFVGASEAFRNYVDNAQNVASQVADAFSRGMDDATDALVKFVVTGKGSFSDLANSIIADLLRIQLQKVLAGVLSNALGAVFGEAFGGPIAPVTTTPTRLATGATNIPFDNFPALLHKGEAVIPARQNPFTNSGGMALGGPNITINAPTTVGAGVDAAQVDAVMQARNAQLKAEIYEDLRRGRVNFA